MHEDLKPIYDNIKREYEQREEKTSDYANSLKNIVAILEDILNIKK